MWESAVSTFNDFRENFRPSDAVDIFIISFLLYSFLIWFRETASRRIAVGISLLTAVYFFARAADLYLTSLVFHTGFAVLLIILVVMFQEDLRRVFERVAAWGTLQRVRQPSQSHGDVDALVEAAFHLAGSGTGALIVLPGRDPLDRHLDGGILLGGKVSKPLLYSIFDASSPGHDGAAIIKDNRLVTFSAHLPISKNQKELRGRGTRHSAGLGLSECSDAFVIVVSEERGAVTVAQNGKLRAVPTVADLKGQIDRFLETRFPKGNESFWRQFVTEHAGLKVIAVILASLAWLLLAYDPSTIQRTFVVPIEYRNLPKKYVLVEDAPSEARVTLSGSERQFRFLDPSSLKISLDLNQAHPGGNDFSISEQNVNLPPNLNVYRISPRTFQLYLLSAPAPKAPSTAKASNDIP